MTSESDNQDDAGEAATLHGDGLWGDVRFWVNAILSVFGDLKEVAQVGLTRSLGVKLCNWLWGVEGAIRRLIIAEALKLDPSDLAETRPRLAAVSDKPRTPHKRRPSFRIFGFNRQAEPQLQPSIASTTKADLPDRWHILFPADPLLSIGVRPKRARHASNQRRINPLDRRGRISRFDPDYVGEEEDYETALLGLSPHRPAPHWQAKPARPKSEPVLAQDRPDYLTPRSDPFDWRRVEEEWKRQIPAPHLAARVFALAGIMDNKDRAVARVARFFARCRDLKADIVGQPPPELAWPRRARSIYRSREVEDLVPRSHAELWRLDTS